jgi:hypothetical protein
VLHDLQIEDYVYLDLEADHQLGELGIDMFVTTAQHIQLYENIPGLVSGRVRNFPAVVNVDHVSIDQILSAAKQAYLSPLVAS